MVQTLVSQRSWLPGFAQHVAMLLLLGVTGLMELVYKLIPLPVVRGVQLSQDLSFAFTAVKYVRDEQNFVKGKSAGVRPWLGLDGLVLAPVCACFIVIVSGAGEEQKTEAEVDDALASESRLPLQLQPQEGEDDYGEL
uniref:Uncharacterized protein n=1 Tax=Nelumbo nucifera TaxID=4432 RepID=A0A822Y4P3_NELNU|nr:TPA_asm: hypothetical protein HUJ06_028441 [Nelumbo nucifera]